MFWRIDKTDTVLRIRQKFLPAVARFENSAFSFHAQRLIQTATFIDEADEALRVVRIQAVDHEYPRPIWVRVDCVFNVFGEIGFCAGLSYRSLNFAGGHYKVGDQTKSAVADVIVFIAFSDSRTNRFCRRCAFERLDARFLVATDDVDAVVL